MTYKDFKKNKNPITAFFMDTLEDYEVQREDIALQIRQSTNLIQDQSIDINRLECQDDLQYAHHFLIMSMDFCLNDLNYFKSLNEFERGKVMHTEKDQLDLKNPQTRKILSDTDVENETSAFIDEVCDALKMIQAAFTPETRDKVFKMDRESDVFYPIMGLKDRFFGREDINERMEYIFWFQFNRRLGMYSINDEMADYLDACESDPEERCERIQRILSGTEKSIFPPQMCTLDGFSKDEIEEAQTLYENGESYEDRYDDNTADDDDEEHDESIDCDDDTLLALQDAAQRDDENQKPFSTFHRDFSEQANGKEKMFDTDKNDMSQNRSPQNNPANVTSIEEFRKRREASKRNAPPKP